MQVGQPLVVPSTEYGLSYHQMNWVVSVFVTKMPLITFGFFQKCPSWGARRLYKKHTKKSINKSQRSIDAPVVAVIDHIQSKSALARPFGAAGSYHERNVREKKKKQRKSKVSAEFLMIWVLFLTVDAHIPHSIGLHFYRSDSHQDARSCLSWLQGFWQIWIFLDLPVYSSQGAIVPLALFQDDWLGPRH